MTKEESESIGVYYVCLVHSENQRIYTCEKKAFLTMKFVYRERWSEGGDRNSAVIRKTMDYWEDVHWFSSISYSLFFNLL